MARIPVGLLVLLTGVLAGSCGMCTCSHTTDEQQILALIDEGARLAEQHDLGGLLDTVTQDVMVLPRRIGRQELKGMLLYFFQRYPAFSLHFPRPSIEHQPGAAQALASVILLMIRQGEAVPDLSDLADDPARWAEQAGDLANLLRLKLDLRKEDGDWRVSRVKVESFRGFGFE